MRSDFLLSFTSNIFQINWDNYQQLVGYNICIVQKIQMQKGYKIYSFQNFYETKN